MSVRVLVSSSLVTVMLATAVAAPAADASSKPVVAKIALVAKKKAAKKHVACSKRKAAKKSAACKQKNRKARKSSAKRPAAPAAQTPAAAAAPAVVAPPAPAACANTDLIPDAGNLEAFRAAIECLHNQIRSQYGLGTLAANGALATAGAGHAADMVSRHYFDHNSPEGGTFDQRLMAAGYADPGDGWTVGENLAWGTGQLATPAALMNAWMNSAGHRENLLKPVYRELGLGVTLGTPTGAAGGVTVAAEFGVRGA